MLLPQILRRRKKKPNLNKPLPPLPPPPIFPTEIQEQIIRETLLAALDWHSYLLPEEVPEDSKRDSLPEVIPTESRHAYCVVAVRLASVSVGFLQMTLAANERMRVEYDRKKYNMLNDVPYAITRKAACRLGRMKTIREDCERDVYYGITRAPMVKPTVHAPDSEEDNRKTGMGKTMRKMKGWVHSGAKSIRQ